MSTQFTITGFPKRLLLSSFMIISLFFTNCKENISNQLSTDGTRLVLNVEGVVEDDQGDVNKSADISIRSNHLASATTDQYSIENLGDFYAVSSLQKGAGTIASDVNKVSAVRPGNLSNVSTLAAVTPLTQGVNYRVLLYESGSTSTVPISSTLGIAGTALSIPVEKGKTYDWVVYSFNDETDPGLPSNGILNTDQRDLLHVAGTAVTIPGSIGDGQEITVPLNIRLKHKLSRIRVELSAANYPGMITTVSANLVANNYFRAGTLNLKTGVITPNASNTVMANTVINLNPSGNTATKSANFYTVPGTPMNNFQVRVNSLILSTSSGLKSFSSPRTFTWPPIINTESSSYTAKVDFLPPPNPSNFKILSVGSAPYLIVDHANSGIYQALKSTANFGPTGTVPTLNTSWDLTSRPVATGGLVDLNTAGYKLLYMGYSYGTTTAEATAITTFLNNGGTVIMATEAPGALGENSLLNTYAGTTTYASWGVLANTTTNSVLNGKFGDARSKLVGNDAGVGYVITNPNLSLIDVLATNSANVAQIAMFKSKTRKLYWVGDGGFSVYTSGYNSPGSGNGSASYPFLLTSTLAPYMGSWYTPQSNQVANSTVIMNIIAQAFLDAQ